MNLKSWVEHVEILVNSNEGLKRVVLFADDFPIEDELQKKIREYGDYIIRFMSHTPHQKPQDNI